MTLPPDRLIETSSRWMTAIVAGRWMGVGAAIVAWVLVMRGPYLATSGADDGFFTVVAQLWRQGILPYVGAFDVKPPGFFAVLAVSQSVFGSGLTALRVVGVLSDALTMGLALHLARRFNSPGVGIFAIVMFARFWQSLVRDDCYSLLIALTTLAMTIGLSSLPVGKKALLVGLAIGAACLVKQTAVFEGFALVVLLMWQSSSNGERFRAFMLFLAAAAILPFACAVYFAAHGALPEMITDIVGFAVLRPGANSDNVTLMGGLSNFALYARGIWPILLIAVLTCLWHLWTGRGALQIPALALWLASATIGIIIQHALLPTYLGLLLIPSLLLAGLGLAALLEVMPSAARAARIGIAILVGLQTITSIRQTLSQPDADLGAIKQVAARLQASHPLRDDRLYIIDSAPKSVWLYALAGMHPATKFLIPSQSMCDFPNVGPSRIAEAFASRPRFVVTETWSEPYPCAVESAGVMVQSALSRDYHRIAKVQAGDEAYDLYEVASAATR